MNAKSLYMDAKNLLHWKWPALAVLCAALVARANPPAPYNLIYGVARDMYGAPLTSPASRVILQTPSGVAVSTSLVPGFAPGVNFRLKVPMDSGITPDIYQPTALLASSPFKLYVVINGVTNLPIQMTVSYQSLGQPARSTRIDVTVGVDSNGDGIPDAWEYAFLAALGLNVPLSSLTANTVLTPDGATLWQQYIRGTYPFDPTEPCLVTLSGFRGSSPVLQFPTVTGRYYRILASSDAINWTPVSFYLPTDTMTGPARNYYYATGISTAQVYLANSPPPTQAQFYKIAVQ